MLTPSMSHRQPLTVHDPNRPTSSYVDDEFALTLPFSDAIGNLQVALTQFLTNKSPRNSLL
jgi:hypothetical protein